jgi:hypothetical protein
MSDPIHAKVLIIGSGAAGYTAAIYAARASLNPVLVRGMQPGGQLTITTDVENYPGFADVIQGPWLMEQMAAQAEHVGTTMVDDLIVSVDFDKRPLEAVGDGGQVYTADAVVIATGASARYLGLESEREPSRAVASPPAPPATASSTANQKVAVIGGGNTAVEEALYLSNIAAGGDAGAPPRRPARREDPAGPPVPQRPASCGGLGQRARRGPRRTATGVTGIRMRNVKTGDTTDAIASTACSSPSATSRTPSCSGAKSTWTMRAMF